MYTDAMELTNPCEHDFNKYHLTLNMIREHIGLDKSVFLRKCKAFSLGYCTPYYLITEPMTYLVQSCIKWQ